MMDFSPILNLRFLRAAGVGDEARGYCRTSRSLTARGGLIVNGGKEVVVVVVVVTTVVRVVGAKENCPMEAFDGPWPSSSLSSISRFRGRMNRDPGLWVAWEVADTDALWSVKAESTSDI